MAEQKIKPRRELENAALTAFRRYAPELHRYIARRMRDPASVPDLMQQVFERFLQVPRADVVRNTQGYLYGIASNVVKEYHYREEHSLVTFDSEVVQAVGERIEHAVADDLAEQLALQQDLRRALNRLPPAQRAVLLLVKREGWSYEEVAQKTGLTLNTVTNYVFEARAQLKMLLKHEQR
ncbi:MAG TPA: RNA polymerase sigma factor [Polyangiaceae bacterium]|nr:RNA polymerase sigma factor [Polyangiaceae bacterium]